MHVVDAVRLPLYWNLLLRQSSMGSERLQIEAGSEGRRISTTRTPDDFTGRHGIDVQPLSYTRLMTKLPKRYSC